MTEQEYITQINELYDKFDKESTSKNGKFSYQDYKKKNLFILIKQAQNLCTEATKSYPNNADVYYEKAKGHYLLIIHELYKEFDRECDEYDDKFSGNYYQEKNLSTIIKEVQAICDEAIVAYPNTTDFYYEKARGFYVFLTEGDEKNFSQKEVDYLLDKAEALNPDDSTFVSLHGDICKALKQFPKAIECFSKAIAIAPNKGDYYASRGYLKCKVGDYEGALADVQTGYLKKGLKASSTLASVQNYIFRKLIAIDPLYASHSECTLENGQKANLLTIEGKQYIFFKLPEGFGYLERENLKFREFLAKIHELYALCEKDFACDERFGHRPTYSIQELLDMIKKAQAICDEANYFNEAEFCYLKAKGYYLFFQNFNSKYWPKNAEKGFNVALDTAKELDEMTDPHSACYDNLRAHFYYTLRSYKKAQEYFSKSIEVDPDMADNYAYRGMVKYFAGDYEGALADVQTGYLKGKTKELGILRNVQNSILREWIKQHKVTSYASCTLENGQKAKIIRLKDKCYTFYEITFSDFDILEHPERYNL